ncbi:MAG TPA: hypothetical protein PKA61_11280 [Nitrospira sp.]|nr:hypothetical protein [Nitrospira sp.]
MDIMRDDKPGATFCERRLLELLREKGPQTLDSLCSLPDMSWSQVLMAVDHLSRSHEVVLKLIAPCEYHVSLAGEHA